MPSEKELPMTTVNTATVGGYRKLTFNSVDELLAEIDRIIAADRASALRRCGNWTAGQIFGHLAAWINYGWEGYPGRTPPWFIRFILRRMKIKYLRDGMRRGVRIPRVKEGTFGLEPLSTEEGAQRLRQALARLKNREPVKFDSPAFGKMSDEERVRFQLRHAELHLGYLQY